MKKFLMALFALVAAASVATAGVGITWTTGWGVYDHTVVDLTGGTGAMLDTYSGLWQLIYAGADNTANAIDDSLPAMDPVAWAANDYLRPGSDDALWAERTIAQGGGTAPEDGTSWNNWMVPVSGSVVYEDLAWGTEGYVYQRVFEIGPEGMVGGMWYHESSLLALNTAYSGGGQPTQDFPLDSFSSGVQPDRQVSTVPEPATMALLGLGALGLAIRRRRA